jgi:hypothetical protein
VWNLVSVCLEMVLVSKQDRCMVCTKHTIGSEIILDALDDSAKHTIGSEIILDALDDTPR